MFDNLLPAEQKLLEACRKGGLLDLAKVRPSKKTKANEIKGTFLRQLILSNNQEIEIAGNKFILKIDPKGIHFSGVYVSGAFDFSFCETRLPFLFAKSFFEKKIDLFNSKIAYLNLDGSRIIGLNAEKLICESYVFLRNDFQVEGEMNFAFSKLGEIACTKAKLLNENQYALRFNDAIIQGKVNFKDVEIKGSVDFESAQIGKSLIFSKAKITYEDGRSLNCDNAVIKGNVLFQDKFEAKGRVSFSSAQIGGNLTCLNANFINEKGISLGCTSAIIQGNVFMGKRFFATGNVIFSASKIGKIIISSQSKIKGNLSLIAVKVDTIHTRNTEFLEQRLEKNGFRALDIDGLEYNHLLGKKLDFTTFKKWLSKMPEFKPQPYKQLAKVLRNMGHYRDADEIMITYHDFLTQKSDNKAIKLLRKIYKITAGYGYKPTRVFITMALIWFLCGTFFWATSKVAVFAPSDPLVFQKKESYECNVSASGTPFLSILDWSDYNSTNNWVANTNLDGEYSTFSPYWYSLDILLPIVDLQMDKDWGQFVPSEGVTLNHVTRWVVWSEILLGWIFSLILVAILSGLAKNEKD